MRVESFLWDNIKRHDIILLESQERRKRQGQKKYLNK